MPQPSQRLYCQTTEKRGYLGCRPKSRRVFGDSGATDASSMQEEGYGYEHETREPRCSS